VGRFRAEKTGAQQPQNPFLAEAQRTQRKNYKADLAPGVAGRLPEGKFSLRSLRLSGNSTSPVVDSSTKVRPGTSNRALVNGLEGESRISRKGAKDAKKN
jgi:hypothetical protein